MIHSSSSLEEGEHAYRLAAVCAGSYLVTECTLLSADVSDQVPGLFRHLVQEHIAQRQAPIPYVVPLRKIKAQREVISLT